VFEPAGGRWRGTDAVLDGVIQRAAAGFDRSLAAPIRTLVDDEGGTSGGKAPVSRASG
jgi:hypothetical protein